MIRRSLMHKNVHNGNAHRKESCLDVRLQFKYKYHTHTHTLALYDKETINLRLARPSSTRCSISCVCVCECWWGALIGNEFDSLAHQGQVGWHITYVCAGVFAEGKVKLRVVVC